MKTLKHILKLIRNRRKQYLGIFVEQALIALILMVFLVKIFELTKRANDPGLLDTSNTFFYGGNYLSPDKEDEGADYYRQFDGVYESMKALPYVSAIARTQFFAPYTDDFQGTPSDSVVVNGKKIKVFFKASDEKGAAVFRPVLEEGAWFGSQSSVGGKLPVIITRQLADQVGWSSAVGKEIFMKSRTFTVVGVIAGIKERPLDPSQAVAIFPAHMANELNVKHKNSPGDAYTYVVRLTSSSYKNDFSLALYNETKRLVGVDKVEPVILEVDNMKSLFLMSDTLPLMFMGIAIVFLTIFAFIGTFGQLWLYAQKQLKEYALRVALGATRRQLLGLVIAESLLITCFAMLPALLLAAFIYHGSAAQLLAVAATVGVMLLFSAVSAWLPAWRVSNISPSEALQYE